jgi:hypothetical protein
MADPTFAKEYTLGSSVAELDLGLGPSETLLIASATVCNTDATARTITVHLASDGAAAATGNTIEYARAIRQGAGVNTALSGKSVKKGGKIYAGASAAAVVVLSITGFVQPE